VTYNLARVCLGRARSGGLDEVEYLNRVGLILSSAQQHRLTVEALRAMRERINGYTTAEFLRRDRTRVLEVATPDDLHRCIRRWIDEYIIMVENRNAH
jgi:hypothetical protein